MKNNRMVLEMKAKIYRVTGYVEIEVVTLIEAESEEEAEKLVYDRDVSICIHGSEFTDGLSIENEDFVLVDGSIESLPKNIQAEEVND